MKSKRKIDVLPRFRIVIGKSIAFGPGKANLLKAIVETGSLRAAAAQLNMSYMRAWNLVQTMNECFQEPLVIAIRGGKEKGGTKVTTTGIRILRLYKKIQETSKRSTTRYWQEILREMKK